jgi:hypothetical protein
MKTFESKMTWKKYAEIESRKEVGLLQLKENVPLLLLLLFAFLVIEK